MEKQQGERVAFAEIIAEEERQIESLLLEQEKILGEKEILTELLNKRLFTIALLEEIREAIPKSVEVTGIEIFASGQFYLLGNAAKIKDIRDLIQNLSNIQSLLEINLAHLKQNPSSYNFFKIEILSDLEVF